MDFRERYGMKEDGTLGPGELVKDMGKKSKMAYNMVRGVIEGMANARTGRRWLG